MIDCRTDRVSFAGRVIQAAFAVWLIVYGCPEGSLTTFHFLFDSLVSTSERESKATEDSDDAESIVVKEAANLTHRSLRRRVAHRHAAPLDAPAPIMAVGGARVHVVTACHCTPSLHRNLGLPLLC